MRASRFKSGSFKQTKLPPTIKGNQRIDAGTFPTPKSQGISASHCSHSTVHNLNVKRWRDKFHAKTMANRFMLEQGLTQKLFRTATGLLIVAVLSGFLAAVQSSAQSSTENTSQSIADTWQGTLHAGQDARIVFKISKAPAGYSATFYGIDQDLDLPVNKILLDGSTLRMTLAIDRVTYEGKLSADGKTITGTWSQGPSPLPLVLSRATPETAWTIPAPEKLQRMDEHASAAFDVATIKPAKPDEPNKSFLIGRRRFKAANANLDDLITFAYGLHPKQVIGAPAWGASDKFDIEAQPDREGVPSLDQWKTMLRKLLEDRCKLSVHHDQKEMPVYVLSVGKTGPKLTPSLGNAMGLPGLGFRHGVGGDFIANNATIGEFINSMTRNVKPDRPIIDKTGLNGRYDFTLDWAPDDSQFDGMGSRLAPPPETPGTLPSLYTAIQEQLGLKLEATRASADVLIIDHIERPSEN